MKKGAGWKFVLIFLVLLVVSLIAYFMFFFNYTCEDLACFKSHQAECAKTSFIRDTDEGIWEYKIKGLDQETNLCQIYVSLIELKKGEIKLRSLQGKDMTCWVSLGSTQSPESDISACHGILKEELQAVIINNLHSYILENVGEIGEELQRVI